MMNLNNYDTDLLDILSPAELSPLPNEPPPPPYLSQGSQMSDAPLPEYRRSGESVTSSDANAMQSKIRSVMQRLAETHLENAAPAPPVRSFKRTSAAAAAAAAVAAEREAKEAERKQKMQELRAATAERVGAMQSERQQSERRRKQQEADDMEQLRKARKEELARLKERREQQIKLASQRPEQWESAARLKQATQHYRRRLLVGLGLAPWVQLVSDRRLSAEKAENFYSDRLLQMCYSVWKNVLINGKIERRKISQRMNMLAISYYRRQLLRFVWKKWKLYRKLLKAKALTVGGEFSRYALRRRGFLSWKIAYERRVRQTAAKMHTVAIPHSLAVLRRHYMGRWKSFVRQARFDRDVQLRTDLTWSKVQGWLASEKK